MKGSHKHTNFRIIGLYLFVLIISSFIVVKIVKIQQFDRAINTNSQPRFFNVEAPRGNILADDSTLVFNSATQSLAITNLDISGDVDLTEATNKLDVYSNHASTSSNIVLNRSKGTKASPTALVDNDNIFGIKFVGHDGTSYTGGASIISDIDGSVSTGNVPGDLSFKVTNASGAENTALRIGSDSKIYFSGGDLRLDSGSVGLSVSYTHLTLPTILLV